VAGAKGTKELGFVEKGWEKKEGKNTGLGYYSGATVTKNIVCIFPLIDLQNLYIYDSNSK
jgi:hypothetical protein